MGDRRKETTSRLGHSGGSRLGGSAAEPASQRDRGEGRRLGAEGEAGSAGITGQPRREREKEKKGRGSWAGKGGFGLRRSFPFLQTFSFYDFKHKFKRGLNERQLAKFCKQFFIQ